MTFVMVSEIPTLVTREGYFVCLGNVTRAPAYGQDCEFKVSECKINIIVDSISMCANRFKHSLLEHKEVEEYHVSCYTEKRESVQPIPTCI